MADIKELMQVRRDKMQKLIDNGVNVHPERYERTHQIKEARELPDGTKDVSIAGRVMSKRKLGKISFLDLRDLEGHLQLVIKKEDLGEDVYKFLHETVDIGDFIGVKGEIFTTQAGEKSLQVYEYTFLGKAIRPLPEKFHGLTDQDAVYRDVYLRISPELTLKKLIIGGFSNVYEIARDFRNEGMDANHLQDFTMVEGYSAYWCYRDNMKFLREMIIYILSKLFDGNLNIKIGEQEIDFGGEWQVVSFRDLILKDCGIDIDKFETAESLLAEIKAKGIKLEADNLEQLGRGNLIDTLYKKVSRPNIINPTYLIEHPIDLSPLARSNDENPKLTDRFQLVVNGQEIINGYSELVDCDEQEKRFIEQAELKANGDEEAMSIDTEYIRAMQYGMPPISGWGLGIDRFLQFLTNSDNIRDVVLYPLMKPRAAEESEE